MAQLGKKRASSLGLSVFAKPGLWLRILNPGFAESLNPGTYYDEYDTLPAAKTDPLGQTTRYRYDAKGRLIAAQLPSGATLACGYDPEDNLTRYVDENGAETRLDYCGQGQIKRRIQPDGYVSSPVK